MDQVELQAPNAPQADKETVVVEFEATCQATLTETWRAAVPAGLSEGDLRGALMDKLASGDCEFIHETSDNEHDRELTVVIGPIEHDTQAEVAH